MTRSHTKNQKIVLPNRFKSDSVAVPFATQETLECYVTKKCVLLLKSSENGSFARIFSGFVANSSLLLLTAGLLESRTPTGSVEAYLSC